LELQAGAGEAAGGQPASGADAPAKSGAALLRAMQGVRDSAGRHLNLNSLFRKKEKSAPRPRKRRMPRYWWLGRAMWMLFVVLVAAGLTKVINWLASGAESGDRWGFVLAVWTFAVVTLLESIKALYQKREKLSERYWMAEGDVYIDDLTGNNRQRADALVRQQCALDLNTARRHLNDLRARVYRGGDVDLALRIRQLEQKIDDVIRDVNNPNFGSAPYISDLKIGKPIFEKMLDYDEALLERCSALSDKASTLQKRFGKGEFQPEMIDQWEADLDVFLHRFASRSRALKADNEDNDE